MVQPRFRAFGQVDLGDVTGDHGGRAEADAGQEHFHLLDRGVLAFVENDETVVQRAAAHVGQWRDFDHLALDQLGHVFKTKHFVQCVVERAQVRVYFLRQVTRQETELLTGLNRRAHQQDAADLLAFQGINCAGHSQIGFTRTRRANAEVDVVAQDLFDVTLLVDPARADHALFGAQRNTGFSHRVAGEVLYRRLLQEQVNHVRRKLGGLGFAVQAAQQVFCRRSDFRVADQLELVTAIADFDRQALLDQAQMLVELPAQIGETAGLKGLEKEAMWFDGCVQGRI